MNISPKKKSIETISDEMTRLPVRAGDVFRYKFGSLYAVTSVVYGAGTLRGNYLVCYAMCTETDKELSIFSYFSPKIEFCKEIGEFCEDMTMYSGQNATIEEP